MILLPFCVILLPTDMSFYVSCGIMVFVGIVIAVGAGQGYAGILLNILRYIILYFFNGETESDINNGAYLFFFVSGFILVIAMLFSCMLYNNEYFLKILNKKAVVLVKKEKKATKNGDEELYVIPWSEFKPQLFNLPIGWKINTLQRLLLDISLQQRENFISSLSQEFF